MAIVGFNFTKLLGEKKGKVVGKININNNLALTDLKEIDVSVGAGSNRGLAIHFNYTCKYEPAVGTVDLEGEIVTVDDAATVKKAVESWKQKKVVEKSVVQEVMPYILNKCSVEAIIMSRDTGLPSPVPLPKIDLKQEADKNRPAEKPTDKVVKK